MELFIYKIFMFKSHLLQKSINNNNNKAQMRLIIYLIRIGIYLQILISQMQTLLHKIIKRLISISQVRKKIKIVCKLKNQNKIKIKIKIKPNPKINKIFKKIKNKLNHKKK